MESNNSNAENMLIILFLEKVVHSHNTVCLNCEKIQLAISQFHFPSYSLPLSFPRGNHKPQLLVYLSRDSLYIYS